MKSLVDKDGVASDAERWLNLPGHSSWLPNHNTGMYTDHFCDPAVSEQSPPQGESSTAESFSYQNQFVPVLSRKMDLSNSHSSVPLLGVTHFQERRNGYLELPDNENTNKKSLFNLKFNGCKNKSKRIDEDDDKTGSVTTIFTVWNTIMGSSLLTMAWGIERAGLIPGIILMIIMGGLCLFTSYIILSVNKNHGSSDRCEISDLCEILLGKWWKIVSEIFSFIVMIGANIVYWVLMTSFLYHSVMSLSAYILNSGSNSTTTQVSTYEGVLCANNKNISALYLGNFTNQATETKSVLWDLNSTVPLYVTIIIFPLINIRNDKFFKQFTSLGTLSVLYLIIFIIVKGAGWGLHIESWVSVISIKTNFTALSGMLALSFYIHNIIITVMSTNRRQDKNGRDLSIAFLLVIITYILAGSIFYICFPLPKSCIEDNILNNFVKSDLMTAVARILLLFQVVTVFPLIAFMLRRQVLSAVCPDKVNSDAQITLFNVALMVVCILFACFVPKIGTIIRYTGALSGLVHIFTLPSILQMTSLYKRGKLTTIKIIFYVSIFLIGLLNLIAQFFVGD